MTPAYRPAARRPIRPPALVHGTAGLAIVPRGRLVGALGFTFTADTITKIEMISDRERLRFVDVTG
jgi:hypothetical protein